MSAGLAGPLCPADHSPARAVKVGEVMHSQPAKWSWSFSSGAESNLVAVVLMKQNHTIALTFPRPEGWGGATPPDEQLVRSVLFSAAEERWESKPIAR